MQIQRVYLLAGLPVGLTFKNVQLEEYCRNYECHLEPLYEFNLSSVILEKEREKPHNFFKSAEELEILAFHRIFSEQAIFLNILLFHSSALMVDGKAYLFSAPSGTGKSTHASLWREMLGDQVTMINDDKPFIRKEDGRFIVYGSPWNGGQHLDTNTSAPLAGICFMSQANENVIRPLAEQERFQLLVGQTYRPDSEEGTKIMLKLLVEMSEQIPMWHLDCNISREAAELSYNTMRNTIL